MITISKNELMERWDNMPQVLKDALWSEYSFDIVDEICKREHLSEDKISTVATLVGDVIMGFLLPEDLSKEIARNVEINQGIADNIAREVETKILRPIMNEIKEIYAPPTEKVESGPGKKEGVIQLERIGEEKPAAVRVGVAPEKPAEGQPLVIHREEPTSAPATAGKEEKKFKGFDFPFDFMKPRERAAAPPVKVKVEAPGAKFPRKEEKRVVHYSEYRTPLTPFGRPEEEIIDIPTLARREPPPKAPLPPPAPKPEPKPEQKLVPKPAPPPKPVPEARKEEVKKGPSIEGNIIDLKNL